ncbi:preprotein translocase subunit SecG [Rickettsiella endosymbiont of Rhagonycha lignosa]|jgi:preprotein translocase subunit SecG|uniref:preprotein translocase subunit SecG n=1 Tax=Rickettsiella endosymbiont of Rhagonycha lignosa TaxID=3077937 RepID=UPI00313F177E
MLQQFLVLMHVIISIALIALVLIQQGKGAELGATFGSAASQTVFGSQGSGSFLLKLTGLLALLFFVTSLSLGYLAGHTTRQDPIQNLANMALQSSSIVNKTNNAEKNLSLNKNTGKANIDHQQSYPLPSEFS